MNKVLAYIIIVLLLIVNWLTFHDIAEAHTLRDWLTLLATILVFYHFYKTCTKKSKK